MYDFSILKMSTSVTKSTENIYSSSNKREINTRGQSPAFTLGDAQVPQSNSQSSLTEIGWKYEPYNNRNQQPPTSGNTAYMSNNSSSSSNVNKYATSAEYNSSNSSYQNNQTSMLDNSNKYSSGGSNISGGQYIPVSYGPNQSYQRSDSDSSQDSHRSRSNSTNNLGNIVSEVQANSKNELIDNNRYVNMPAGGNVGSGSGAQYVNVNNRYENRYDSTSSSYSATGGGFINNNLNNVNANTQYDNNSGSYYGKGNIGGNNSPSVIGGMGGGLSQVTSEVIAHNKNELVDNRYGSNANRNTANQQYYNNNNQAIINEQAHNRYTNRQDSTSSHGSNSGGYYDTENSGARGLGLIVSEIIAHNKNQQQTAGFNKYNSSNQYNSAGNNQQLVNSQYANTNTTLANTNSGSHANLVNITKDAFDSQGMHNMNTGALGNVTRYEESAKSSYQNTTTTVSNSEKSFTSQEIHSSESKSKLIVGGVPVLPGNSANSNVSVSTSDRDRDSTFSKPIINSVMQDNRPGGQSSTGPSIVPIMPPVSPSPSPSPRPSSPSLRPPSPSGRPGYNNSIIWNEIIGEDKGYGILKLSVFFDEIRSILFVTVHEAR
jgi:hypothetical protein